MSVQLLSRALQVACVFTGLLAFQLASRAAPGDRPGVGIGPPSRERAPAPFAGRISRVDETRRALMLEDVLEGGVPVTVNATSPRTARGTATGAAGTAGSKTGTGGSGGRGAGTSGDTGIGKGTTTGPSGTGSTRIGMGGAVAGSGLSMTFSVADKVTVTLDGKPSSLKELKVGYQARLHTGKPAAVTRQDGGPGSGLGSDSRDPRAVTGNRARAGDDRGGIGLTTNVWKIEAYSRPLGGKATDARGSIKKGRD